ncbi:MAG: helix-turn-helix domain-containing protein [Actinomycetota bacterium]|nr:helix-turn-helix domain-containing protein [Actinomycetota bacterium]
MEKLLLTPEEASEALSIGRSKLYELLADGTLESVAIGACRRVPRAAIEQFVDRLRTSQSEDCATPGVSILRKQRVSAR